MSNAKIISIIDHDIARSRRAIDENLTRLALELSVELANINKALDALREEIEKLKRER